LTEQDDFKKQKSDFEGEVQEFKTKKAVATDAARRKSMLRNEKVDADKLEMVRLQYELDEQRREMAQDFGNRESELEAYNQNVKSLEAAVESQKATLDANEKEMHENKREMERVKSDLEVNIKLYLDNKKD
jgi:uncharacterized protein involved in exopolysaccharide biosynthesis